MNAIHFNFLISNTLLESLLYLDNIVAMKWLMQSWTVSKVLFLTRFIGWFIIFNLLRTEASVVSRSFSNPVGINVTVTWINSPSIEPICTAPAHAYVVVLHAHLSGTTCNTRNCICGCGWCKIVSCSFAPGGRIFLLLMNCIAIHSIGSF